MLSEDVLPAPEVKRDSIEAKSIEFGRRPTDLNQPGHKLHLLLGNETKDVKHVELLLKVA